MDCAIPRIEATLPNFAVFLQLRNDDSLFQGESKRYRTAEAADRSQTRKERRGKLRPGRSISRPATNTRCKCRALLRLPLVCCGKGNNLSLEEERWKCDALQERVNGTQSHVCKSCSASKAQTFGPSEALWSSTPIQASAFVVMGCRRTETGNVEVSRRTVLWCNTVLNVHSSRASAGCRPY